MECKLFFAELAKGIYRISDSLHGPNSDGFSDAPGQATQNSYLILGEERAALIDMAVDTPELYSFACRLANKPVTVLLTHGHPDHVYYLETAAEAWLHPADHDLVKKGIPGICPPVTGVSLHPLMDGQQVDLGGRRLEVLHLPGHTMGSVLFLDRQTGTLFTGDTCARRLLYGLTPTVPLEEHCKRLEKLSALPFDRIYTAHDRCGLPKTYLKTIISCIRQELPKATETIDLPGIGAMRNLHWGNEDTPDYFDAAIVKQYLPESQVLQVGHLRTLHRAAPIGIDGTPEFSWMLSSSENNVVQSAYCLIVRAPFHTVWDSGIIHSPQQSFLPYEGLSLQSKTKYTWQVTVWDQAGNAACGEGHFETGILHPEEWQARWIKSTLPRPEIPCPPFWTLKPPVQFEKTFRLNGKIASARLYAAAHGIYRAYVNDMRPDDREFAPEHTVYEKVLYYQTYPVESLLRQGQNTLRFYVADGWYFCPQTRQELSDTSENPAVLFQLEITYQDGRVQQVCSDGSEQCFFGTVEYADLFLGERRDDTRSEGEKHLVALTDFSVKNLCAQPMEPVRPVAQIPARTVYRSPKGEWIVDFGQMLCGRVRIRVDAPKGAELTFEYFEVTDRAGNYCNTMIAPQRDVYISNGSPCQYEAAFTFHGFRYLRVSGADSVHKEDFTAVALSTEKENLGAFECSDSRLNRLYQNIRWSQRSNMLSIPTDCPSREKGGFTGDIQIYAKTAMLNEEMTPFLTGWLKNLKAAQAENGAVPITVPETAPYRRLMAANAREFGDEPPVGVAGWSDAAVLVPYTMYRLTGNRRILEEQYESMTHWCGYIIRTAEGRRGDSGLPHEVDSVLWNTGFHFGEWLIPSEEKGITQKEACQRSAFYTAPIFGYLSVKCMAEISEVLQKPEKAYYSRTAGQMKAAIQAALICDGELRSQNMGAYVLMIAFDLVPEHCKEHFAQKLVSLLDSHHGCLDTGFLATPFLLDAFVKIGRRDLAIKLLWQTRMPSWLYEVEQGATSVWESWDAITPGSEPRIASYNHYAFGCVDAWIFENIAGIRALEPGFRRVEIAPDPDGLPLEYCRRSFRCEYGELLVFWNRQTLRVSIPCGVRAVIRWHGASHEVGSGEYTFTEPHRGGDQNERTGQYPIL